MAYVSVNKEMLALVEGKMVRMRTAELNGLPDPIGLLQQWAESPAVREMAEAKLWLPVVHLQEQLRPFNQHDKVKMVAGFANEHVSTGRQQVSHDVRMDVPCIYNRASKYDDNITTVTVDESESPEVAAIADANRNRQEAAKRWDAVIKQVTEFLKACKSLNEAVKLWPDVVRYVNQGYLDRMQIKTEKAERTSTALDALRKLDLDAIQSSNVLARMAGAAA
jgi:hypothetical protein